MFYSLAIKILQTLLGDNLSSHISPNVIKACEEKEIKFVCLPPNSTHITQPLDVAFFKPLGGKLSQSIMIHLLAAH